jgi:hypothetical protein
MAALVAKNAEAPVSRIQLQPGINTVGRAEGNHHVIPHSSVSSRHCEIVVHDSTITVRDLGSTNGTFVDDEPAQKAPLRHGGRLKLGNVEFVVEAPGFAAPKPGSVRVAVPISSASGMEEGGRTAAEIIAAISPSFDDEPNFYRQIPGTFVYPFKRNGIILLVIGTIVFTVLDFFSGFGLPGRGGIFSLLVTVFSTGYLFAYMQKIIAHTAQGDDEMPDFPDFTDWWSDIILPFLLFAGTIAVSLAPLIVVGFLMVKSETAALAFFPALALGALYLPMALLAVAVTDNFLALSPHVVVPSIVRVFVPYLVTFLLLALLVTVRMAGGTAAGMIPLQQVALKLGAILAMGFTSLYLLTVEMRLLGLLFRRYRARLGWL